MNAEKTGGFIAALRKEKELTQAQLAEMLHVSDKAVSRWETGRGFPDVNLLDDIAEALGVSAAEILKGERLDETISREDADDIAVSGMTLAKELLKKKKILNALAGFFVGLALLTIAFVHANSPIYIEGAGDAVAIEKLPDGRIVGVISEKAAGYDFEETVDPDSGGSVVFLSCYETLWNRLYGEKREQIVILGDEDTPDGIYYYPGSDSGGDELLYQKSGYRASEGVVTLPRLVYNYWIIIGWVLSVGGIAAYLICRKRRSGPAVLKAAMLPIAFTLSAHVCLLGKAGQVYNAAYYFSGILLLTAFVYALMIVLYMRLAKR